MKKAILVALSFALVTIVLTWGWTHGGRGLYGEFLRTVAPPIYDLIGFPDARVGALRQRYINFIPFLGLVIATPGLTLRRKGTGLITGGAALIVGHLALNLTEGSRPGSHLPFVPSLVSDALPFILWVIVAYPTVGGWFANAFEPRSTDPTQDEAAKGKETAASD